MARRGAHLDSKQKGDDAFAWCLTVPNTFQLEQNSAMPQELIHL